MESGLPIFRQNFTCSALLKLEAFAGPVRDYHPLGYGFPTISGYKRFETGLVRFRSPLLTESLRFPFLWLMRCFSSPGLLQRPMYSSVDTRLWSGFPHSEIPASKPIGGSAGLIAAYHVLHRLCMPRHPPNALLCLKSTPFAAVCLGSLFPYAASRGPTSSDRHRKRVPGARAFRTGGTPYYLSTYSALSTLLQERVEKPKSRLPLASCRVQKTHTDQVEPLYVYKPRFPTASALPPPTLQAHRKRAPQTACGEGHRLLSTV